MPKGTFGASCRIIARDHGTGRKAYGYIVQYPVHQVAGFTLLVPGAQVAGSRASFFSLGTRRSSLLAGALLS